MGILSKRLRELAVKLRKEAEEQRLPKPIPNPMASKTTGDLGTLAPQRSTGGARSGTSSGSRSGSGGV